MAASDDGSISPQRDTGYWEDGLWIDTSLPFPIGSIPTAVAASEIAGAASGTASETAGAAAGAADNNAAPQAQAAATPEGDLGGALPVAAVTPAAAGSKAPPHDWRPSRRAVAQAAAVDDARAINALNLDPGSGLRKRHKIIQGEPETPAAAP